MPRGPAKQFDPTAALERAMELFWKKGFAATSMSDIRAATGLGAKSLYDTFGNKRALYAQAIEHYTATVVNRLYGGLADDPSPAAAVAGLLPKVARLNEADHRGCLLGVAMAEARVSQDEELVALLKTKLRVIEDALHAAFDRAKSMGELRADVDTRSLARLHAVVLHGANLVARVEEDTESISSAHRALEVLIRAQMVARDTMARKPGEEGRRA